MRFGFAGVKHPHAKHWATAVKDNGGEVVAVFDPDPAAARTHAAAVGGTVVQAVEDLSDFDLDAVIVDGRCDELEPLALGVMQLGLPLLLEKPGAMTTTGLARIVALAREKGVATQMGYFLRYAETVETARAALQAGELGQLSLVRCHAAMPHRAWDVMRDWFADPTNITSIFQEDACHVVDILVALLGVPRAVVAQRVGGNFAPTAGEDALACVWDYGTLLATIDFTAHEANPWIDTWCVELYGSRETFRFGLAPAWQERYRAETGWVASGEPRLTGPSDGFARAASSRQHYRRGLQGLIDAIAGRAPAPVDVQAGLVVLQIVEAIAQAADRGVRVSLHPEEGR